MDSSVFSKREMLGLAALVTIGLLSLAITFVRTPVNQVIINGGVVKSSPFDLAVYNNAGDILLSVSPLNDFFYTNKVKDHLSDKIITSTNANFAQDIWLSLKALVLNKKELIWNTVGSNASGKVKVNANYVVNQINGGIEIQRTFSPSAGITSLGQAIKFCADCLVTDDKNRAYFNADTVGQFDINTATRLHLTSVVVGENQFLPQDISEIKIIDRENNLKLTIPVKQNQVFLQYKWRLLEFKADLGRNGASVSQEVVLDE
jgi:hypothetical protein